MYKFKSTLLKVVLTTFFILFNYFAFSQTSSSESEMTGYIGGKIGLNNGWMYISDLNSEGYSDVSSAFMMGIYGSVPITKNLSISPELIYSVDGGKYLVSKNIKTTKFFYRLSLPVILKIHLNNFLEIHTGPQIGYLFPIDDMYRYLYDRITYDYTVGLEAHIKKYSIGLRYNYGLQNLYDEEIEGFELQGSPEYRLRTLQIYVGININ
ncbi:MAG: outer membrane beta-barrel protein [Bacteroidota bacterium]